MAEIEIDYKKNVLHQQLLIKGIHERINAMGKENIEFVQKNEELNEIMQKDKQGLEEIIEKLTEELSKTKEEKQQKEDALIIKNKELIQIQENNEIRLKQNIELYEQEFKEREQRIQSLEKKLENIDQYQAKKTQMELLRENLKQELEIEKQEKQQEMIDKDKEKQDATDKLKKEMLHDIQKTKTQLLALNKGQLSENTNLTLEQNKQLTTELEYQSKQTEKLLFKNSKLQEQVVTLKRDIEIHKQVEQELAKRTHFCQKLINQLKDKIHDLEQLNNKFKTQEKLQSVENQKKQTDEKNKDDIIQFLEKNLDNQEKKITKIQYDYQILKDQNHFLQKELAENEESMNKQGNLQLQQFLNRSLDMLQDQTEKLQYSNDDLKDMANKNLLDLNLIEQEILINLLIEYSKPYLNKNKSSLPLINTLPSTSMKLLDINVNLNGYLQDHQVNFPKLTENQTLSSLGHKSRFQGVPLEISTKIVRSNKQQNFSIKK